MLGKNYENGSTVVGKARFWISKSSTIVKDAFRYRSNEEENQLGR